MTENQKWLQSIEEQLQTIRNEYHKLEVQRARLEGKEAVLLDLRDIVKAMP